MLRLDLTGVFNNVFHGRLLWVLRKMGFPEWVVQVIESFLTARRTKIAFADYESRWYDTQTGIPQGSTLSPALFILFISDLLAEFQDVKGSIFRFGFIDNTILVTWGDSARANY